MTGLSSRAKAETGLLIFFGASGRNVRASGPLTSLLALIAQLKAEVDILLVIEAGLLADDWQGSHTATADSQEGFGMIARNTFDWRTVAQIIRQNDYDLILLNSFFDRKFTIPILLMRRLGLIPRKPIIISPRGEFAGGALSLKAGRKLLWLALTRVLGLTRDIWFHATAPHERADIVRLGLPCRDILDAPDTASLPEAPVSLNEPRRLGPLRIVFLGRIVPIKNIIFALDVLARVSVPVEFDIYGPLEDQEYWHRCEALIGKLPDNVLVRRHSPIAHDAVPKAFERYDLLFLPSLGENFGHVIHEALAAGVPVLLSDKTPWTGLSQADAGWELPLGTFDPFVAAIEHLANSSRDERLRFRRGARRLAEQKHAQGAAAQRTKEMIEHAISEAKR